MVPHRAASHRSQIMMDREDLRNVLVSLLEEEMDESYDLRR